MILIWFTYLFYQECVTGTRCDLARPVGLAGQFGATLLTVGFLTALMIVGSKRPMVWKGPKRTLIGGEPSANPFEFKDGTPTLHPRPSGR